MVRGINDAVRVVAPGLSPPSLLDVRIKWPNDLYTSSGLNIGGVLIHTTWSADRVSVVTGVGLNVANRLPTTCLTDILAQAVGASSSPVAGEGATGSLTRELLLASIVTRLEECFQVGEGEGSKNCCFAHSSSLLISLLITNADV